MIIDKPQSIPALHALWHAAFGDPDGYIDAFFAHGYHEDRCLCAYEGDALAAALYWFDCSWEDKRLAYMYAVATDPAFRGQGICRKLMTYTHDHLKKLGYAGAVLVPGSEALFAMYEKFGYRCFGGMRKFTCEAGEQTIAVNTVSPEEYASVRRRLLPAGGVVQESATLDFLASQVQFYTAGGSLFCAAREENTLIVPEFLGDASAAPGIVSALGCTKGHFRAPGADPFAMYLPFTSISPAHFGIALD